MFKDLSISVRIGIPPDSKIASIVATKVKDWVITSSPLFRPRAARATLKAADPEETPRAYWHPRY
jgi:hypothetical protein